MADVNQAVAYAMQAYKLSKGSLTGDDDMASQVTSSPAVQQKVQKLKAKAEQLSGGVPFEKLVAMGQKQDAQDVQDVSFEDFVRHLDNIVAPVLTDDEYDDEGDVDTTGMDLDDVGSELDQDDDSKLGKGYNQDPMADQLEKVVQSQGDDIKNPQRTVTTDDGKTLKVTPDQARVLRMLMTTDKVKPQVRAQFQKDIQHSHGLQDFLDMDYQEMPSLFVKRYLG
jgi:hypothetical protein